VTFDLFVIGGGSAGVRCARIAAGLGARVGIAEARFWGGTCVNNGCVPKKILVQAAEYRAHFADAEGFGWRGGEVRHDWRALIAAKDREIARLNGIYKKLLTSAGVEVFETRAWFEDAHTLRLEGHEAPLRARYIVIATGGRPLRPDIPGAELGFVSDDMFFLPERPERVVILGSGYIAVEFASIFNGLGSKVDLVFRQPKPLRGFDADIRETLAEALTAEGITLHSENMLTRLERRGAEIVAHLREGGALAADLVLFATGRAPATAGLGLERAGVAVGENGAVLVDAEWRTRVPHIYAIGDVIDRINLTPVATAQGHVLAERLFGEGKRRWNFEAVPSAVFSIPPVATVGLSEEEAARREPVDVYLTRFTPMRHTISGRPRKTMMKLVVAAESGRLLGAHMVGDDAPEIIQGFAAALTAGATKADLDQTVGIHPTAAEEFVTMRTPTRRVG